MQHTFRNGARQILQAMTRTMTAKGRPRILKCSKTPHAAGRHGEEGHTQPTRQRPETYYHERCQGFIFAHFLVGHKIACLSTLTARVKSGLVQPVTEACPCLCSVWFCYYGP